LFFILISFSSHKLLLVFSLKASKKLKTSQSTYGPASNREDNQVTVQSAKEQYTEDCCVAPSLDYFFVIELELPLAPPRMQQRSYWLISYFFSYLISGYANPFISSAVQFMGLNDEVSGGR